MKKPIIFTPALREPVGINNYSGKAFRCFTKGDTIPFRFTFKDGAGAVLNVTGQTVWVHFSDKQAVPGGPDPIVSVEIPLTDLATGVFSGNVSDTLTNTLPAGIIYAQALYVNAAGESITIDMCMLEVYPAVVTTPL